MSNGLLSKLVKSNLEMSQRSLGIRSKQVRNIYFLITSDSFKNDHKAHKQLLIFLILWTLYVRCGVLSELREIKNY